MSETTTTLSQLQAARAQARNLVEAIDDLETARCALLGFAELLQPTRTTRTLPVEVLDFERQNIWALMVVLNQGLGAAIENARTVASAAPDDAEDAR